MRRYGANGGAAVRSYDSGWFLSRAITGGVLGGIVAAIWGALWSGLTGLPWWSALALYSTTFGGISHTPVVAAGLGAAVVAGIVWLVLVGMALGAVFGLVAGTAGPGQFGNTGPVIVGTLLALVVFGLALSGGVQLLSPAYTVHVPLWGRAVAFGLMGFTAGSAAAR